MNGFANYQPSTATDALVNPCFAGMCTVTHNCNAGFALVGLTFSQCVASNTTSPSINSSV